MDTHKEIMEKEYDGFDVIGYRKNGNIEFFYIEAPEKHVDEVFCFAKDNIGPGIMINTPINGVYKHILPLNPKASKAL